MCVCVCVCGDTVDDLLKAGNVAAALAQVRPLLPVLCVWMCVCVCVCGHSG